VSPDVFKAVYEGGKDLYDDYSSKIIKSLQNEGILTETGREFESAQKIDPYFDAVEFLYIVCEINKDWLID
jgi:hypothetical protein